jgi:GT2 family glycosyltransferase
MKVLVCVPHTGSFQYQFVDSFTPMMMYARVKGIQLSQMLIGHSLIYEARKMACQAVLDDQEIDYLLFLDSDMVLPMDLIPRLLEADKPIVSALAFKRTEPHEPCIFNKCDMEGSTHYFDYPKGLVEIQGVGMACCLIKREVIEKTPQPWFFPMPEYGEDLAFCIRAKQAGFSIWADTNLVVGHIMSGVIGEEHYKAVKV